ncbi:MAG: cytochrome b [Caldimonas sp.]
MPIDRYTRTAVVLHWLIAVLILFNVVLALSADHLPDDWVRPVIDTHKSTGITVLGLVLLRILWRVAHRPPDFPVGYARWERIAAQVAHGVLYALILLLPISGWMHDSAWKDAATHPMTLYGLVPWPRIGWIEHVDAVSKEHLHDLFGGFHTAFGYVLYGLLALHIGGALKHQWMDREPELQRMSL